MSLLHHRSIASNRNDTAGMSKNCNIYVVPMRQNPIFIDIASLKWIRRYWRTIGYPCVAVLVFMYFRASHNQGSSKDTVNLYTSHNTLIYIVECSFMKYVSFGGSGFPCFQICIEIWASNKVNLTFSSPKQTSSLGYNPLRTRRRLRSFFK